MDRGRFKKKQDDKAWLDWLSDDIPESEITSPDDSFPIDSSRRELEPLPDTSPELEPEVKRQPKQLTAIPVVPEAPPERRPIFGSSDEAPSFARQRPQPEERVMRPVRATVSTPAPALVSVTQPPQLTPHKPVAPPEKPRHAFKHEPAEQAKQVTKTSTAAAPPVAVSIQINMPAFHKPQFKRSKAAWVAFKPQITRGRIIKVAIPVVVIALLWSGLAINKKRLDHKHAAAVAAEASSSNTPIVTKPPFTPIVPATNAKLGTPDNIHSKYDATKKSYSFVDSIGGKLFTVSQQQLPTDGTSATDTVTKVAKSLNATTKLKTGYGTAYLLTNQKYNSQSLVFSVRDQLMFINSSFVFTNDQWTDYINALN